jgi:hypothetical protein
LQNRGGPTVVLFLTQPEDKIEIEASESQDKELLNEADEEIKK